ncbi:hypothetical protein P168DRAFT_154262 [Aspergillus campestris IBT 28561]|uniref:Uncharacterized protein n=1 Tax=Aspergillus campestris (strain IBT 28561) TaxID=1392248 RepID=A0A2I1D2W0_ASPC2|nr:uncharacterized protein P168DRAFT_154262 [Aspergillus campestris IBT 28561]PKY04214.1 hypothetical protein P168DRAFT_154262 [Aspergillus campestris IBT 28561]
MMGRERRRLTHLNQWGANGSDLSGFPIEQPDREMINKYLELVKGRENSEKRREKKIEKKSEERKRREEKVNR